MRILYRILAAAYNDVMRLIMSMLFFVAAAGIAVFALTVLFDPVKTYDLFANLPGDHSLEKEPLVAFVPPKGNFRVWFPGTKPGELNGYNSFLRQTPLPTPQYYFADKDLGYFATAWKADLASVGRIEQEAPHQNFEVIPQEGSPVATPINVQVDQSYLPPDPIKIQTELDREAEGLVSKIGGIISSKFPIGAGGGAYPGRSVEGKFANTNNDFRLRLFLDQKNNRWFCVCVVGKTKRAYSAQSTKFLNSMDIWS